MVQSPCLPTESSSRGAWNQDHAWFRPAEARSMLPAKLEKGAEHEVPRLLVERLVRFHLVDNVHALNYAYFPKEAVEKAGLKATVVDVQGRVATVPFTGESRAATKEPFAQGYAPQLLGHARFDSEVAKFVSFELVAVGQRWGTGNCNQRHDPKAAPMGIAMRLAADKPAERLPPAFISHYDW